jgi:DNA-binding MarR family transcriptional regulator
MGNAPVTTAVLDSLRRIVHALRESSRQAEMSVGVSGAQLFVLQALMSSPALSLNELAALTHTHQSSVSTVVTRLAARKLIRRTKASDDARRIELTVTPGGRRLLAASPGAAQERLVRSIARLPGLSQRRLAVLLNQVADGVDRGRQAPSMFFEAPRKDRRTHA